MRGEGGRRREGWNREGRRRERRGGLSGNVAEDAFCIKSAPAGTGREGRNGRKDGSGRVGEGRGGKGMVGKGRSLSLPK